VLQVTNAQVGKLARLAAGRPADSSESSNGNGSGSSGPELVMDDFRHTAEGAYAAVDVPDTVVDILAELRCYLQVSGVQCVLAAAAVLRQTPQLVLMSAACPFGANGTLDNTVDSPWTAVPSHALACVA
jgi:hypothetical protein